MVSSSKPFSIGHLLLLSRYYYNKKIDGCKLFYVEVKSMSRLWHTLTLSASSHSKGSIGYNLSFKLGGGKF